MPYNRRGGGAPILRYPNAAATDRQRAKLAQLRDAKPDEVREAFISVGLIEQTPWGDNDQALRRMTRGQASRALDLLLGGQPERVVVTRFAGGGSSFRNSRGRCEDAPCCGCCSAY